jgi:HPr kinase/phosphorylase
LLFYNSCVIIRLWCLRINEFSKTLALFSQKGCVVFMSDKFTVPLSDIIEELSLNTLFMPSNTESIFISSKDVNRPGLELAGFLDYFDKRRILVIGNTEHAFLSKFSSLERRNSLEKLFSLGPPAVIITRNLEPIEELLTSAKLFNIPILLSYETTSIFVTSLASYLNSMLAPRITHSGELVDVYGEGIFLTGESGVGKSETAIELIKRGHRLIADDIVEIRRISKRSLIGSAPKESRHFLELRGIGFINACRIFGMGAVKVNKKIHMVIRLENWEKWEKYQIYDRIGLENEYTEILGIQLPILKIPVKPGRNLAIIIEVAAMNNRQKKMGYNATAELLTNLGYSI